MALLTATKFFLCDVWIELPYLGVIYRNTMVKDSLGLSLLKQLGACKLSVVETSTTAGRIRFFPVVWAVYAVRLCERLVWYAEAFLHFFRETLHASSLSATRECNSAYCCSCLWDCALMRRTLTSIILSLNVMFTAQIALAQSQIREIYGRLHSRIFVWSTRWRCWLRHCAAGQKVASSIPDGVMRV